jgi:hypothetical protein
VGIGYMSFDQSDGEFDEVGPGGLEVCVRASLRWLRVLGLLMGRVRCRL